MASKILWYSSSIHFRSHVVDDGLFTDNSLSNQEEVERDINSRLPERVFQSPRNIASKGMHSLRKELRSTPWRMLIEFFVFSWVGQIGRSVHCLIDENSLLHRMWHISSNCSFI